MVVPPRTSFLFGQKAFSSIPHDNPERFHSGYAMIATDSKIQSKNMFGFSSRMRKNTFEVYIFLLETGKTCGHV